VFLIFVAFFGGSSQLSWHFRQGRNVRGLLIGVAKQIGGGQSCGESL